MVLRHAADQAQAWDGGAIQSGGIAPVVIEQSGTLVADDVAELTALHDAIRGVMDGQPRLLTDDLGRRWTGAVLVAFEPAAVEPLGTRWQMKYSARYVQVQP